MTEQKSELLLEKKNVVKQSFLLFLVFLASV